MANVTNVMISIDIDKDEIDVVTKILKGFMSDGSYKQQFVEVSKHTEGYKPFESCLFIGAFNYFDFTSFNKICWEVSKYVDENTLEHSQVYVKYDQESEFEEYSLSELGIKILE